MSDGALDSHAGALCSPYDDRDFCTNSYSVHQKNGGVCFKNFCKGRDSTLVNHLGEDLGQDLGQDLGEDLGEDLGQDLRQDVGQDLGEDLGQDLGQDLDQDLGQDARAEIKNFSTKGHVCKSS